MAQQLAPDIVRKFFELVYPHTRGRDYFKLSHGGRGGVSAVLELQELHPGDVVHSKAGRFAASDRDEGCAIHSVSLQLLHHLETQGILPNDWWRWPPDWQLSQEPGVVRFTLICALLNMKEGYYTPRKNITTYGISSSCYNLAETILDEMIAEGSVTQNSMQQVRLASLEEFNRRQQQLHQLQQPAHGVQQPAQQSAYAVPQTPQQLAYAYQQPSQQTYVVSYANPEQVQQPAAGYSDALPIYTHQQQRVVYSYPAQAQQEYQQPQQPQVQQQSTAGAFDRTSAWQEARQAAVTAPASTAHAAATSARATSSHAAAVGASGGGAHATSSREYRATAPSTRDQQAHVHSSRYASVAAAPADITTQKRPSWVDERILQWQQQSQQPPPVSGVSAGNSSGNAAADHPFSMTSPRRLEQQRRRSSSQVPAFGHGDANGPSRVTTGQIGAPTERRRHRSPSSTPRYAAAAGSPRRPELDQYRHTQHPPLDRIARQSPQRRHSGSSSDPRSGGHQPLPPLEPREFDRFDRREPEPSAHVDHRVDQRHLAVEEQQYKRPKPSLDLQQRQQLQPGRWMEDHAAAGAGWSTSGVYSAGLKRDREAEHRSTTAHSGSSRGNSAVQQSGPATYHTRSGRQDVRGLADRVHIKDHHHLGRDLTTASSPRSRDEPVASPRFPRHTAAAPPNHRDRSRSSSRHDQLPPSHKRPWHDLVHDRSAADRERGGAPIPSADPRGLGQGLVERVSLHSHGSDRDRFAGREKVAAAAAADKGRRVDRLRADGSSGFRDRGLDPSGNQDRSDDRKHSRESSERDRKGSSNDKDRHCRSKSTDRPRDKDRRSKERELDNSRTLQNSRSDRNSSWDRRDRENRERSGRDRDRAKDDLRDRSLKREEQRDDRGRMEQQQQQQQRGKQTQQGQRDVAVRQQQLTGGTSRDSAVADGRSAPSHDPVKLPDTTQLKTPQQLAAAVWQYISAAAPFAVDLTSLKAYFAAASSSLSISGACLDAFIARLVQEGLLEVFEGSDRHKDTQYVRALHSSWSEAVIQQISLAAAAAAAGSGTVDSAGGGQGAPGLAATTVAAVTAGSDQAASPASTVAAIDVLSHAGAAAAAVPAAEVANAVFSPAEVSPTTKQQDNAALAAASKGPDDQHSLDAAAAAATRLQDTAAAAAAEVHPAGDSGAGNFGFATDAGATAITTGQGADGPVAEAVRLTAADPIQQEIHHAVDAGAIVPVAAAGPTEVVAVAPQAGMQDKAGQAEQPQLVMAVANVVSSALPAAAAGSALPSGNVPAAPFQAATVAAAVAGIAVADELGESAAAAAAAATELADVASNHKADSSVAEAAEALAATEEHHAASASNANATSDRSPAPEHLGAVAAAAAAAAPCGDPMEIIDADVDSNAASDDEEMPDTVPASPVVELTAADAAGAAVTDAALAAAAVALPSGVPFTAAGADCERAGLDVDSWEARDAIALDAAVIDLAPAGMADTAAAAEEPAGNGVVGPASDDPAGVAGALDDAEGATPQAVADKAAIAVVLAAGDTDVAADVVEATEHTEDDAAVLDLLPRAAAEEPAVAAAVLMESE